MCSELKGGFLHFCNVYRFFDAPLPESLDWLAYALAGFSLAFIVINVYVMSVALYVWFERRAIGRFQSRLGPNRWGPFGLFQPFADIIKLITKEDIVPEGADRPVFNLAPILFLAPSFVVLSVIPFGQNTFLGRLNIGVLFLIAVTSVNTIAVFMAGWSSRNKYGLLGAMRGVAMLISYEVPMGLALAGVLLTAGSLALFQVVQGQHVPFLLVQPLAFLIFVAAASAEMNRTPFDQIEAESELGAGYHTEYSGMKFAIFQLAEFLAPVVTAMIATTVFLSGWRGFWPIPGQLWFLAKVLLVLFILVWVRSTWPRLRVDQIMGFAWKGLFPLALVNLFVLAAEVLVLKDPATGTLTAGDLWLMAAINWVVALASIIVIANILGQRRIQPQTPVPSPLASMQAEAD